MLKSIRPSTLIIIFSNVLIFMLMQILLFWYVISREIENIIINKSILIKRIIMDSNIFYSKFNNFIQSEEYINIYNKSINDKKTRIDFNLNLTWEWMLPPFLIVICILIGGIIYAIHIHTKIDQDNPNSLRIDKTDSIILTTVFFSFLTEIIIIFILIMRYVYISDMDIIIFFSNIFIPQLFPVSILSTYSPTF